MSECPPLDPKFDNVSVTVNNNHLSDLRKRNWFFKKNFGSGFILSYNICDFRHNNNL